MTENDYLQASNLTRIRFALDTLTNCTMLETTDKALHADAVSAVMKLWNSTHQSLQIDATASPPAHPTDDR